MFGLGKEGNEESPEFDLEKELKEPGRRKEIEQKVRDRMLEIKTLLRSGGDPEVFNKLGILLHGYVSLRKVIARVKK